MTAREQGAAPGSPGRLGPLRRLPVALVPVLIATLAAIVLGGTVGVAPAAAATDDLRLAVSSTYRVDPAGRAVHVAMAITATNEKPDTATTVYYYDSITFALPLEATAIRATSNGSKLEVTTAKRDEFRRVTIHIPKLYHGKTRTIRQTFDLPSGKPRSASPIRVGKAYASFEAWAWGDPGHGDVRIVMPPGFTADITTIPTDADAQLTATTVGDHTEYVVKDLADPIAWYSTVEATNRDALTVVPITAAGEPIVIHAWPEDRDWVDRVSAILGQSLPDLEHAIGLPWPVTRDLEVTEVAASEIAGYAGFFNSAFDRITISEDLDDLTIVHEASHAWFDGDLFQERWIDEGLADEYASRILAADHLDQEQEGPGAVAPTDKAAFDLNTWRPPDRIDAQSVAYERFGSDASWTVMRRIVDDVTEPRMRDVFKAAAAQTVTYLGAGPAERSGFVADWRRFLDLVTDVGGSTKAEDLLETWVLTPKQDAELPARDAARTKYFDLVREGGDWLPGIVVRKPMSDWRFPEAEVAIADAADVLDARDGLETAASELGLPFPTGLETAYESAASADDLTSLGTEIGAWTDAATAVRTARDGLAAERSPLVQLGLVDTDPDAGYRAALAAFAAGDEAGVMTGTAATVAALAGAEEIGRGRAVMAGLAIALVVVLLLLLIAAFVIRRRRPSPVSVPAGSGAPIAAMAGSAGPTAAEPVGPGGEASWDVPPPPAARTPLWDVPPPPAVVRRLDDPTDPYATLAATPDHVGETQPGAPGAGGAEPD
jgi:hypothetical protein